MTIQRTTGDSSCCFNTPFCSKAIGGLAVLTALATTILGWLAITGMFYPATGLGVVTNLLGPIGTYASVTCGMALMAILLFGRCFCGGGVVPTQTDTKYTRRVSGMGSVTYDD